MHFPRYVTMYTFFSCRGLALVVQHLKYAISCTWPHYATSIIGTVKFLNECSVGV